MGSLPSGFEMTQRTDQKREVIDAELSRAKNKIKESHDSSTEILPLDWVGPSRPHIPIFPMGCGHETSRAGPRSYERTVDEFRRKQGETRGKLCMSLFDTSRPNPKTNENSARVIPA